MSDFSDKALGEFLTEAEDIVDTLNSSLLGLDSAIESGRPDPGVINAIFRGAHSLKGLSAMFDLSNLAHLAHKLEDLLDQLRLGKIPFNRDLYAILFDSFEKLHASVRAIGGGQNDSDSDFAPFLGRIERFIKVQSQGAKDDPIRDIALDPAILNVLSEYEEHRLRENLRDRRNLYKVSTAFSIAEFGDGLSDLSERIKKVGEIISTLPNSDSTSLDEIRFDLLVGTGLDASAFRDQVPGSYELVVLYAPGDEALVRPMAAASPLLSAMQAGAPGAASAEHEDEKIQDSVKGISRTVKVDIGRLDQIMNIVGELVLVRSALERISSDMKSELGLNRHQVAVYKQGRLLDRKLRDLQYRMMEVRMVPLRQVFDKLNRAVRRLNSEIGKKVRIAIKGADTELDKLLVDELAEPLMHMIRNSMDHGIEAPEERVAIGKNAEGLISLNAYQKGNHVVIEVADDGKGINLSRVLEKGIEKGLVRQDQDISEEDIINLIFHPGFSTSEQVSQLSGRGVGMDVVKSNISKMGGIINVETKHGVGTTFTITLPITLAIIQALFVEIARQKFAIPLNSIVESVAIQLSEIKTVESRDVIQLRNQTLPVFDLQEYYFGQKSSPQAGDDGRPYYVVIISLAERRVGLLVRSLLGQQDVVIKPFTAYQEKLTGFSGATETGDEAPVLVFDIPSVMDQAFHGRGSPAEVV